MIKRIDRGWALTTYLLLAALLSVFTVTFYAGLWGAAFASRFPLWVIRNFLVISIMRLLATVAIWYWLKEGVITYVILTIAGIAISCLIGKPWTIGSVLGIALLAYLLRRKWHQMRWLVLPANQRLERPVTPRSNAP